MTIFLSIIYVYKQFDHVQERPYKHDSTASRLLSEVKHCRARLVSTTVGDHVGIPGVVLLQLFVCW